MHKLGYVYKKAYTYVEAWTDRRTAFRQILFELPKEKLVNVDESGIDTTDRKELGWGKKSIRWKEDW